MCSVLQQKRQFDHIFFYKTCRSYEGEKKEEKFSTLA